MISGNAVMPIGVAFSIAEDGTLTREKSDVPQSTPFDTPQLSVVRYAYPYDDQGNWTQHMRLHARTPPIISCVAIREYIKRR
jgi:hypothetical protein